MDVDDYDFYRCYECKRFMTKLDEKEALKNGVICKCGSKRYKPCNMSWYHWLLPKVWKFAYLRIRGFA